MITQCKISEVMETHYPIMLLVSHESGTLLYLKDFAKHLVVEEQLVSGGITALTNFMEEILSITHIQRIVINETLFLRMKVNRVIILFVVGDRSSEDWAKQQLQDLLLALAELKSWNKLISINSDIQTADGNLINLFEKEISGEIEKIWGDVVYDFDLEEAEGYHNTPAI